MPAVSAVSSRTTAHRRVSRARSPPTPSRSSSAKPSRPTTACSSPPTRWWRAPHPPDEVARAHGNVRDDSRLNSRGSLPPVGSGNGAPGGGAGLRYIRTGRSDVPDARRGVHDRRAPHRRPCLAADHVPRSASRSGVRPSVESLRAKGTAGFGLSGVTVDQVAGPVLIRTAERGMRCRDMSRSWSSKPRTARRIPRSPTRFRKISATGAVHPDAHQ